MRRNIGSAMTDSSARQAAKATSSGTGQRTAIRTTGVSQGSMAGYKNSKSAYVQHNSGGYNNPENQSARYSRKSIMETVNKSRGPEPRLGPSNSSSILDKRLTGRRDSSISLLAKRTNR